MPPKHMVEKTGRRGCCSSELKAWMVAIVFLIIVIQLALLLVLYHLSLARMPPGLSLGLSRDLQINSARSIVKRSFQDADYPQLGAPNSGYPRMVDCYTTGNTMKQSFPDIDYALLGYNILKGYPLAVGHDPGFTRRLFRVDYSGLRTTADCRYSLPRGLDAIPDGSCMTSFSSSEVITNNAFSQLLSTHADMEGAGGWGASFSASPGYKQIHSTISSERGIYIISQALCNYYYVILDFDRLPPFDDEFLHRARDLEGQDSQSEEVFQFIEYYGSHFIRGMNFGAKLIYQHKMTKKAYHELSNSPRSVTSQASYSSIVSLLGGPSSQKKSATYRFTSRVETECIAVGAPPPLNGDHSVWASSVKDSPVPTQYKLMTIDELFTDQYMRNANFDHQSVGAALRQAITGGHYCQKLLAQKKVASCVDDRG